MSSCSFECPLPAQLRIHSGVGILFCLLLQVVKVADFGVARVKAQTGVMTAETGTYRWMAPEVWLSDDVFYSLVCK